MDEPHHDIEGLDEIIRRIVHVAAPEQTILFGSTARGEAGPNSDLDLLVVKTGEVHRRELAARIYGELRGVGWAVDVIVVTPEDVERYRDSHALVIAPALREGRTIYASPRFPRDRPTVAKERPATAAQAVQSSFGRFPPDDPREWVNWARSKLCLARSIVPDVCPEDLCLVAQQAAEQAIKAVLIARDIEYPYVHDLPQLLGLAGQAGEPVPIPPEDEGLARLSSFAALMRDPFAVSATLEDHEQAGALADSLVRWAEARVTALRRQADV